MKIRVLAILLLLSLLAIILNVGPVFTEGQITQGQRIYETIRETNADSRPITVNEEDGRSLIKFIESALVGEWRARFLLLAFSFLVFIGTVGLMNKYKRTLLRVLTFVVVYLIIFGISLHVKWMQRTTLILLPLIATFIILLVFEARSKIKQSFGYETVLRGCFLFSFLSGFSWSIPFILFGVSVDGPYSYGISDILLLSLGGVLSGGIIGLFGIILINQFYTLLGGTDKK